MDGLVWLGVAGLRGLVWSRDDGGYLKRCVGFVYFDFFGERGGGR